MNGAIARLLPESSSTPAHPEAGKPDMATEFGATVADAACAIAASIEDYRQSGAMAPAVKDASSTRIAKVAELQLDHELGDDDFTRKARVAGRHVLQWRLADNGFFPDHDPAEADAVIEAYIDELLGIVEHVVHGERVLRLAWAN